MHCLVIALSFCFLIWRIRILMCMWVLSHVQLSATAQRVARQAPLSIGFSRQEYCSGLLFPSPAGLPDLGFEPRPPMLQAESLICSRHLEKHSASPSGFCTHWLQLLFSAPGEPSGQVPPSVPS